ncbi:major facilitator superfamily domain-containing protein [Triangularia verruculosa]|uniref:Major facilitator superfamily domain-containing protein n=1 Tax=Triangularia verruculosa TaxID=2587418 RepID=A0AAN7ATS4_9PEZI|nr:major facilitator superfamily domain-containing protein [Triangularia verruculosa]
MRTRRRNSMAGSETSVGSRKPLPPYPSRQLTILALCRICEPIAFMSIFPYIWHMVRDFGITEDENQISFYAGMVTSAFTFAEFSTSFIWGRLSDKIGRKPVLLMGMTGTGISVIIFGFAPNIWVALGARALGGFLNGNIGVLQTTVAELVTVKAHQPKAYTVMPLVWCIGSIVGPMIGGALAKPVESFPGLFSEQGLFNTFPYLLPNLFSAICVFIGVIVGILFLEETHAERKHRPDRGVELGRSLMSRIWGSGKAKDKGTLPAKAPEEQPLLSENDELLPGYRTGSTRSSPASDSVSVSEDSLDLEEGGGLELAEAEKSPAGKVFTKAVITVIISYGILAFHTMAFDSLLPVFLSTNPPERSTPTRLPFKFADGFGWDTQRIGFILSVQGVYSLASTRLLFPFVANKIGALRLFKIMSVLYPLLYFFTPYIVLLPESLRMLSVYGIVVWKMTFSTLAYPSNAILLTNSAPTTLTLGSINGAAAMTASLCRALGPIVSGYFYTQGMESGYSGLSWWVAGLVAVVGAWVGLEITEPKGRMDEKEEIDETTEDESTTTPTTPTMPSENDQTRPSP